MSAKLLDGKQVAAGLKENLKNEMSEIKIRFGRVPLAVSIVTGDDPGALSYAASQKKTAEEIGIDYQLRCLPDTVTKEEFKNLIFELNRNPAIHAVLINKPLPAHIDFSELVNWIDNNKEVEGINMTNLGRLFLGMTNLIPCTAASVMEHLHCAHVSLKGKEVVIIGRSVIVGKPLVMLLLAQNATVTVCHSATDAAGKLVDHVRRADIVIVAIGQAGFLKGDWLKPGAVVVDVGINRVDGKIVGDADYESVSKVAGAMTPVPGGVGPVTSIMLMKNVVEAFKQQILN
jgi:methylenetetrahydrofolate dehydrogenase (NADP+)/methenyltetrahydrofolate cyclohydrolase